jgi:dolichol-phosphate hexosyltransferase
MTAMANVIFGSAISDLHTCLKLLPLPLIRSFRLEEEGFGLDTEISAEMLRAGFRPFEVPASYVGRAAEDGKKVQFGDAVRCAYVLVKVRLRGSTRYGRRDRTLAPRVIDPTA